jgi:hypothetical protein
MHFYLLYEILDAPLHGVSVSFNGVEYNTMSSTPSFEASSMLKFGCAVSSYGLRGMPPKRGQRVQVLPRVLTRASVDNGAKVGADVKHDK